MAMAATGQLNVIESASQGSRSVDCFEKLVQIGEGTYGQVYMARDIQTTEIVALKKIRMDNEKEGFPITAIREIKLLKKLNHENVIKLKEIVTSPGVEKDDDQGKPDGNKYKGDIFMVFEYMDHDLAGLADRPGVRFTIPQIKCYMRQLLTGLHYCHVNQVLHRDIKGPNLLIDNEGNLKLADFGLSRSYSNEYSANLTNRVITLWYRPPELLFGTTKYGPAVDMWSVGCIFAELLHGKPIFPGKDEHDQLVKIFKLCGTPDEVNWPGVQKTPGYNHFKLTKMKRCVRDVFRHFGPHALELLDKMLTLDPAQRISVKDALDAEYFWTDPLPCDPKSLPKYESSHEFQTKKKRQQQWQNEENAKRLKMQHPQQRLPPFQQGGQHAQMRQGPSHSIHGSQPAVAAGASHQRLPPFQQGGQHAQMRQGPSHSIHGSQPAVAAGPSHQRLPPFQQGGQHAQMRQGPSHSIRDSQPAVAAGPSHRNGNPQGPSGGPGRYPPVVNPSGGHNHPYPPPQGRRAHNGSSSSLPAGPECGPRSGGGSGY